MGTMPVKEGSRIESVWDYHDQVRVYEKKCRKIILDHKYEDTVPNGLLKWPGQSELLERYGVIVEQITNEVADILKNKNPAYEVKKTGSLLDRAVKCEYCHSSKMHETIYKIRNTINSRELILTNFDVHAMEHQDLGRHSPKDLCDFFGIGKTDLPEDDPLHDVALFYHLNYTELDRKINRSDLFPDLDINTTLMMSATSGRGSRMDDDF